MSILTISNFRVLDYAFNVLLIEILEDYSQVLERKEKIGEKNYSARMEAKHKSTEICTKLHAQPNFNGAFKAHPQHKGKAMTDFKLLMTQVLQ